MTKNLETKIAKLEEEFQKIKQQLDEMKEWNKYIQHVYKTDTELVLDIKARMKKMAGEEGVGKRKDRKKRERFQERFEVKRQELEWFIDEM